MILVNTTNSFYDIFLVMALGSYYSLNGFLENPKDLFINPVDWDIIIELSISMPIYVCVHTHTHTKLCSLI